MSSVVSCPPDKCTGCSACANICSVGAISMREDSLGHLFPFISTECIDCGLCEKVCPALHYLPLNAKPDSAYALFCEAERQTSSSGGAASIICREIILSGGIVYGCSQKESLSNILHIRIDKEEDLYLLKGSKYVQSNIGSIYKQVLTDLKASFTVAFVGTPCQCAGLLAYLRKPYDNLLLIDLVCHGVPSQKMLLDNAANNGIEDIKHVLVDFRRKNGNNIQFGQYYHHLGEPYYFEKNTPYDDYMAAFMTGLSFRESCHSCRYSSSTRIGDITIGDFWRLGASEKTHLKIKDGVSLVLANTHKGQQLINRILPATTYEVRKFQEAADGNANLNHASIRPSNKEFFKEVYAKSGLHIAVKESIPRSQFIKMAH